MSLKLKQKYNSLPDTVKVCALFILLAVILPRWILWTVIIISGVILVIKRKGLGSEKFKLYAKLAFVGVITLTAFAWAENKVQAYTENKRNYYVNASQSTTYECNAYHNNDNNQIYCETRTIEGDFSRYETVQLKVEDNGYGNDPAETDGNRFKESLYPVIHYQSQEFNPSSYKDGVKEKRKFVLYNKILKKNVSETTVNISFKINEKDMALITLKHEEWKKSEEARKVKEEADKKAEEAKKAKKAQEDAARKAAEEDKAQKSTVSTATPNDVDMLDIIEICERHAESKDYPNAEMRISTIKSTDLGDGVHYKVMGDLYIDEGVTSAERSVGTYACTVDRTKGAVTSAFLNSQEM